MKFSVPVKCSKRVEENGAFALSLLLPPDVPGKDRILFAGSREITYLTHDRANAAEVNTGDTLYLALFTEDEMENLTKG